MNSKAVPIIVAPAEKQDPKAVSRYSTERSSATALLVAAKERTLIPLLPETNVSLPPNPPPGTGRQERAFAH